MRTSGLAGGDAPIVEGDILGQPEENSMSGSATESVRSDWNSQARAWFDQRESMFAASRPIHEWLVKNLEPRDGQRVLEVAAGPGDTGFLAARQLGNGRLVSTDLSPEMVDVARQRGAELGIQNADYRVLDAQAMDLADASFDGVLCRWGFMLMPDPAAALRECKRVLVPGGRLAFAVFTGPEENPFASLPARTLMEQGHLPRPTGAWQPGILALGDRGRLQALLDGTGFASTRIEPVEMAWHFAGTNAYWDFLVELTALGPLIRSLSHGSREAFRTTITERLAPFTHQDGVTLPSRCWGGLAIR
jgi:ubiquinone/menaquinone biosynthesis C-methylase UbiE